MHVQVQLVNPPPSARQTTYYISLMHDKGHYAQTRTAHAHPWLGTHEVLAWPNPDLALTAKLGRTSLGLPAQMLNN